MRAGRISELVPGSCFPNWLQGKPRMTRPNGANSSCSAFSSGTRREQRWCGLVSPASSIHPSLLTQCTAEITEAWEGTALRVKSHPWPRDPLGPVGCVLFRALKSNFSGARTVPPLEKGREFPWRGGKLDNPSTFFLEGPGIAPHFSQCSQPRVLC